MNDICRTQERQAMALARTNDPQTSKDAAKKMVDSGALNRQEQMVYGAILGYIKNRKTKPDICNPHDFTTKDIARYWWPATYYNAYDICHKRFSGLENKGKIGLVKEWDTTVPLSTRKIYYKRRDGCRVWRLL